MSKKLGEKLVDAGLASAEAVDQALAHQKITGDRLGDCLVDLGLVQEGTLLRFLAQEYNTRFVTAEKLSKARIPSEVLEKVPVRMAEAQDFMPIAYDSERRILTVVMAEPQKADLVTEIALIADMGEVYPMIGLRSSIKAAIKKFYYGDATGFASLEGGARPQSRPSAPRPSAPGGGYEGSESRIGSDPEGTRGGGGSGKTSSRVNPTQLREALGAVRGTVGENDYLETMNILVGLLEMPRKEFRGHSAQVARQSALIARRMGLTPREVAHTSTAAYLHDLGKRPDKHFTLASISMQPEAKAEAKRYVRAPIKLFETVHLHGGVNTILAQVYEAIDGTGVPQGAKGDDIAAGARIISAVDCYFDLTRNPFNPFGHVLPKAEALNFLRENVGKLFDAVVVDTLSTMQSGDLLKQRLENDGRQIFVADPDEGTRTDLMDSLSKQGVVVQTVLKLDAVIDAVLSGEADCIAAGLAFGLNDLLALTQFVRARPESASLPVLVLGDPTDAQAKDKVVQAGATGFIPLPLNPDEAATSILATYMDRVQHGGPGHQVRGSFDEIAPSELARLLGSSRKSGRLQVRNGPSEGACVFERGRIVYAVWADKKGDQALTALFTQPQAEFQYDPEAVLSEMPNIEKDLDVLARQLGANAAPVEPT